MGSYTMCVISSAWWPERARQRSAQARHHQLRIQARIRQMHSLTAVINSHTHQLADEGLAMYVEHSFISTPKEHIQFMHRLVYECEVKGAAEKLEIHKHMNTTVQNPSTGQPTHFIYYTLITNVPYLDR